MMELALCIKIKLILSLTVVLGSYVDTLPLFKVRFSLESLTLQDLGVSKLSTDMLCSCSSMTCFWSKCLALVSSDSQLDS